jgi:hypothetical protein
VHKGTGKTPVLRKMLFGQKKPKLTSQQALAAKPIKLVEAVMEPHGDGGKLKVPLKSSRFLGRIFRMPEGATKTFEFDSIGLFVWENIDGRITVQQLIRKVARQCKISEREAAVSTNLFLQMLGKKSLIGWNVPENKEKS